MLKKLIFFLVTTFYSLCAYAYEFTYQYSENEGRFIVQSRIGMSIVDGTEHYRFNEEPYTNQSQIGLFSGNFAFDVEARYFLTERMSFSASLGYIANDTLGVYSSIGGQTEEGSVEMTPGALLVQFHPAPYGAFRPYIGAGYHYTLINNSFSTIDFDDSATGLVVQGGFDLWFNKSWAINFDAKYYALELEADFNKLTSANLKADIDVNPTVVSSGISYRF
jgi:outer membrane protein